MPWRQAVCCWMFVTKLFLNKADFLLGDTWGGGLHCVASGGKRGKKRNSSPHSVHYFFLFCDSDNFGFVSLPSEQHGGARNLGESIKSALPFWICIGGVIQGSKPPAEEINHLLQLDLKSKVRHNLQIHFVMMFVLPHEMKSYPALCCFVCICRCGSCMSNKFSPLFILRHSLYFTCHLVSRISKRAASVQEKYADGRAKHMKAGVRFCDWQFS